MSKLATGIILISQAIEHLEWASFRGSEKYMNLILKIAHRYNVPQEVVDDIIDGKIRAIKKF